MSPIDSKQNAAIQILSLAMNDQKLAAVFGAILRMYRRERLLTQVQLGKRVGVVHSFIASLETGKKLPSLNMLLQLAAALEIKPSDLVDSIPALINSHSDAES